MTNRCNALGAKSVLGLSLAFAASALIAATPESGTLTLDSGAVEFGNGPNVGANLTGICQSPVPDCDHFELSVDLPDNLGSYFPAAMVRVTVSWDDPSGSGAEDYDITVYAADSELARSNTVEHPEVLSFDAVGGLEDYRIEILYYTALGSTYAAAVELELGEPADGVDTAEFFARNSVLGRALGASPQDAELESAYLQRRTAAGSVGWFGLILLGLGLRRRR